jgi:hypothetical protein
MFAAWQVGEVLWAMIWFTVFFLWIWLVISVFADVFRSEDLGGVAKAIWCLFVIFLPYLGVFVYLIARGNGMRDRQIAVVRAQQSAQREYIQAAAGTAASPAAELERLADLRGRGVISDEEFETLKAKTLA